MSSTLPTYFNPRFHEGSDLLLCHLTSVPSDFNPRFHEGSDQSNSLESLSGAYFNPRFHEGSDRCGYHIRKYAYISILASTREATDVADATVSMYDISILASTREATGRESYSKAEYITFQSSLPRGKRHPPRPDSP